MTVGKKGEKFDDWLLMDPTLKKKRTLALEAKAY